MLHIAHYKQIATKKWNFIFMLKIKTKTLNITLPKLVLASMDEKCRAKQVKRSEYIRDLIIEDTKQNELLK